MPERTARTAVRDLRSRSVEEIPDGELVRRARESDDWAREALFRRYIANLTAFVTHLVQRSQDADDVVQDAFAEVLRDLDQLREPDHFRSWLFRVAINRAMKSFRRRKLARALGLDRGARDATFEQLAAPGSSPEQLLELRLVDRALDKIPLEERTAWVLRYVHEETVDSIAAILDCSAATAKRRVAAANLSVNAHLEGRSA